MRLWVAVSIIGKDFEERNLTSAGIVREAIFHQVREAFAYASSIFASATIAL